MRIINIKDYDSETMKLGKPIYDSKKRILLAEGRHIHEKILPKLEGMSISHIVVEDDVSKGITLDEMIDMPTWMDTVHAVQQVYQEVRDGKEINPVPIQSQANKLLEEVQKRPVIVLVPTTSIEAELQPYAHSVNVTLLSLQLAKKLSMSPKDIKNLTIGTLLHDVGKAKTDDPKEHPKAGFDVLRQSRELNLLSAHIAFQHHERMNGAGFPRGISGNDVHMFAQICGVANQFDNLISKNNHLPHEVMEQMMTKGGVEYDLSIVQALVQGIPAYPPGTKVVLNTGEEGIVTMIKSHMQRPVVRLLHNGEEINLEDKNTVMIEKIAEEKVKKETPI